MQFSWQGYNEVEELFYGVAWVKINITSYNLFYARASVFLKKNNSAICLVNKFQCNLVEVTYFQKT